MSFADNLGDRKYISQYAIETLGFEVRVDGALADPDLHGEDIFSEFFRETYGEGVYYVAVRMTSIDESVLYFERPATKIAPGLYEVTISSNESQSPGIYKITWTYNIRGALQRFVGLVEVGSSNPAYDRLDVGMKAIVESAWIRFADLFDSPYGGPHLQVYFQSRFSRGRMAQLLQIALNRLNTIAQPHMTYSLYPEQGQFPYAKWGGLLDQALYIEALKHLRRSYVEQPESLGVNVARLDRRDYMARWGEILREEEMDFQRQLDVFKMAHMGLGRPSVLVAGGAYGNYGPTRLPGSAAARPRYWLSHY